MPSSVLADPLDVQCAKARTFGKVDMREALVFAGCSTKGVDADTLSLAQAVAKRCEAELPILATWRTFAIEAIEADCESRNDCSDPRVYLHESRLCLPGKSIVKHLEDAEYATLMACTLGADCERRLQNGTVGSNAAESLFFGSCTSSLVDNGADIFQKQIEESMADLGLHLCGHRFSPGYGDLPLDVQPSFIEELGASKNIGLYTTDANMLVPTKSITAIMGFAKS